MVLFPGAPLGPAVVTFIYLLLFLVIYFCEPLLFHSERKDKRGSRRSRERCQIKVGIIYLNEKWYTLSRGSAASAIPAARAVVILLLMTSLSPSVAACPMLLNMALDSFNENKDLYTSLLVCLCGLLFPTSEWYVGHELREAEKQAIRHQSVLSSPSGLMWVL